MKSIKLNTKARFFPLKYPRSEVTCQDDMDIKKVDASSLFLVGKSSAREEKNHVLKEVPNPSLVSLLSPLLSASLYWEKIDDSDLDI